MNSRPTLDSRISADEFKTNYWLLEELVTFCKLHGIKSYGGKIDITTRIEQYLRTGAVNSPKTPVKTTKSKFDWANEPLTPQTIITDNYKNSENVRAFFKIQIGEHFKFNTEFMNWMKANAGKNLSDAAEAWNQIRLKQKSPDYTPEIAPQFEYNKYIRDLLTDNPGLTIKEAIACWKEKRKTTLPKIYSREDLFAISDEINGSRAV